MCTSSNTPTGVEPDLPVVQALPYVKASSASVQSARSRTRSIARLRAGKADTVLTDFLRQNNNDNPQGKVLLGS